MKNLFETGSVAEIRGRLAKISPEHERQWGMMTAAQMMAHCSVGFEIALGVQKPPRMMVGRLIGWAIKPLALRNDEPLKKNSPTAPVFLIREERDFAREHERLGELFERFVAAGASGCTTHPHAFFGRMTPDEWGVLMYKHIDHHLRQFSA